MKKDAFHLPGRHYFLSHSVGAQPRTYDAAIAEGYLHPWRTDGFEVWNPWFETIERFKTGLAQILGATPSDICPQSNVSSGIAKLIFSLPERPGRNKIVLTEDDFPTVGFALNQAQKSGYELIFLPGGATLADPDAWARAFEDDVQLVVATHVYSNTSVRAPLADIAARATKAGVFTLFDIAQSAGALPIALDEWGADFAVGTSLKYLCGGAGAAYLWARKEAAQACEPIDVGWFSHETPFEFDIHHFAYAEGATRFTGGTPSIAPLAGACAAHDIINDIGVEKIFAHNQDLLDQLISGLPEDAFLSSTRQGFRGSSALIRVADYDRTAAALKEAGVGHDTRKGAVRISIHLYNDEDDVDALRRAISEFL